MAGVGSGEALLAGVKVVELSALVGGMVGSILAELGADVVKVDPAGGDPASLAGPPHPGGTTLLDLHINGAKRRSSTDIASSGGLEELASLIGTADILIEGVRPGTLDALGMTAAVLWGANPSLVILRLSGFGSSGTLSDRPQHGTAFDAWAGLLPVVTGPDGRPELHNHVPIGMSAGPLLGSAAVLAALLRARATGRGCELEVAHAEAAAWFAWHQLEVLRQRTASGASSPGRRDGDVLGSSARHQVYRTADDATALLMAPEDKLWLRFCAATGRADLADRSDGCDADVTLVRAALTELFAREPLVAWLDLARRHRLPIVAVHALADVTADPRFLEWSGWDRADAAAAPLLPLPLRRFEPEPHDPSL